MEKIYDFKALTSKGKELDFSEFEGKVLLIVNTASKCGFTPQFAGLEELNQKYRDKGLVVIGFPSGDFANQELADGSKAEEFCQLNYGVSFQIMKKVHVNGKDADPVFKYLKSKTRGWFGSAIKWNFTKFLISRDGETIKRYSPLTKPEKITRDIEAMLG
ncbi:MAG: glutathione peroxidase [Prevotella sp.]|jgi:glutathione peroxidase|nr:glutathione peroxidase [Prevotella sp.]MBO5642161.1 glutathione peroxidase [Prevotella sp.]MBQ8059297.1 glutathione peroxidase [Prevotella sp.]